MKKVEKVGLSKGRVSSIGGEWFFQISARYFSRKVSTQKRGMYRGIAPHVLQMYVEATNRRSCRS